MCGVQVPDFIECEPKQAQLKPVNFPRILSELSDFSACI